MESRWILLQFAGVKSGRNKIPPWPLARISLVITEPDTTTQGLLHIWNGFLLPCGGVHAFCKEGKFQIWERNKSGLISSGKVTRSKEGLCSSCGSHRKFTNGLRSRLLASLISAAKLGGCVVLQPSTDSQCKVRWNKNPALVRGPEWLLFLVWEAICYAKS